MTKFTLDRMEFPDLDSVKKEVMQRTIGYLIIAAYETQPIITQGYLRKILETYKRTLLTFKTAIEQNQTDTEDTRTASSLQECLDFLSQSEVIEQGYLHQRDEIIEGIRTRLSELCGRNPQDFLKDFIWRQKERFYKTKQRRNPPPRGPQPRPRR